MPFNVAQKLKVKERDVLLTIQAPADFEKNVSPLPEGVKVTDSAKIYNQVHWFVSSKKQLDKELSAVIKLIKENVVCWIYYPKGTSKKQTDLTRDKGWENLLKHDELQWINLISFDETWSAFGCRLKTGADKKKSEKPGNRPIAAYIDPVQKIVRLPEDFAAVLQRNKKADTFFQKLSFSNKKEYVEWIVTAKREETRKERVSGSIERLSKGWKNPANR